MKKATDPEGYLKHYQISDDDSFFMGTWQTIHNNIRIVNGFTADNSFFNCNWCCGRNFFCIATTYKIMEILLDKGIKLKDLPHASTVKTWPLDEHFCRRLETLMRLAGTTLDIMSVRELILDPEHHAQLKRGY
jgi:hypothetical protein